ncbi:hypothetical protein Elgi_55030 [Paenibacillus elgii]|nr:hypothetical protein Elgi_55030 [Paenibacillus elgii]
MLSTCVRKFVKTRKRYQTDMQIKKFIDLNNYDLKNLLDCSLEEGYRFIQKSINGYKEWLY